MQIEEWYKKYGIRKKTDIGEEPESVRSGKLPKGVVLHYLDVSPDSIDCILPPDDVVIKTLNVRDVRVINAGELVNERGNPKVYKNRIKETDKCVKSIKGYKLIPGEALALTSSSIPAMVNYQGLNRIYEYKPKRGYAINRAANLIETVISHCNAIVDTSDRTNFIYMDTLESEISPEKLRKYIDADLPTILKMVKTTDMFLALELTRYAMGVESMFSDLTAEARDRTILFIRGGSEFVAIDFNYLSRKTDTEKKGFVVSDAESYDYISNIMSSLSAVSPAAKPTVEDTTEIDPEIAKEKVEETIRNTKDIEFKPKSIQETLKEAVSDTSDKVGLKAQQRYALNKKIDDKEYLPNPYNGKPIKDIKTKPLNLKPSLARDNPAIFDKSMLSSTIGAFSEDYINNNYKDDVARMVYATQSAGVVINKYTVKDVRDISGDYELHSVTTTMIDGGQSTIKFKIPTLSSSGEFMTGGTTYVLKKQRTEAPITKVKPDKVLISSYYGKNFIFRSDLSVHNFDKSLVKGLLNLSFNNVIKVSINESFEPHVKLPRIVTALSFKFSKITYNDIKLDLRYNDREKFLKNKDTLRKVESKGVLVGTKGSKYITVDMGDVFYLNNEPVGSLFDLLDITYATDRGVEKKFIVEDKSMASMKILGKRAPMFLVLGYLMGLTNLLKSLNVKTTVSTKKLKGFCIKFSDVYVLVENMSPTARLILQGFSNYSKVLDFYSYKDLDKKDTYSVISEEMGLRVGSMTEVKFQSLSFIDPMTKDVLESMKEPTEYIPLLIRAVELIGTDELPNEDDGKTITDRLRGYERIPGTVYTEFMNSIRSANRQLNVNKKKLAMSDYAIWASINGDPAIEVVKAVNPIAELKEHEAVVLTGTGGFSKQAISEKDRKFRKKDLGVISESTPDSGDVGVTTFLAPNAKILTTTGLTSSIKDVKDDPSSALSTSMLLSPGSDKDDAKRANMISVQMGHAVSISGAEMPYIRTGYDLVVASRTSGKFAKQAKMKGKVKSVSKTGLIVKYDDKTEEGFDVGEINLSSAGKVFPTTVVTKLKKGDKFSVGDILVYNKDFFQEDDVSGALSYQNRVIATTALSENVDTYEDGSAMSEVFSRKLTTGVVKVRDFLIEGSKQLASFPAIGQKVDPSDKMFVIHTPSNLDGDALSSDVIESLKDIGSNAPSVKYKGTIKDIIVYYHGDRAEFTNSINSIITERNRVLKTKAMAVGLEPLTCEVDGEFKVKGTPLAYGTIYIKILIGSDDVMGPGDKIVTGSQMKSTVSSIYTHSVTTEDGRDIDMFFSYRAAMARLVPSGITTAMGSSLLKKAPAIMKILMEK